MKVAFYKAKKGNWLDFLINLLTGMNGYSHVELVLDNNLCYSISPRDKKTRFKKINLYDGHWDVYELYTDITSQEVNEKIASKLFQEAEYDYLGILFSHVIKLNLDDPFKLYCSECVGKLLNLKNPYVSPNKLFFDLLKNKMIENIAL